MEVPYILGVLKKLWDYWDVRGFMLLSFALQTFLFFLAPFRCCVSSYKFISTIFCLYLLADWAANYAAGVISSGLSDGRKNEESLAFWCSFLLVHLGGPDSITAFALQDNDFWHRHALAIVFQCISTIYIFIKTFARNKLKIPTVLVFISGVIRYSERTTSLYSASIVNLRDSLRKTPDPGPSYSKVMNAYRSYTKANFPARLVPIPVDPRKVDAKRGKKFWELGKLSSSKEYTLQFFKMVKRLVVDLRCSHVDRRETQEFFLAIPAQEAFMIIATELNSLYRTLFTKAIFLDTRAGVYLRLFSWVLMMTSLGLFYYEKKEYNQPDVAISYTLLLGAIANDVMPFICRICFNANANTLLPGETTVFNRKWSEYVSTLSLVKYCLSPRPPEIQRIMNGFGLSSYFDRLKYVDRNKFTMKLWQLIFDEVKSKSDYLGDDLESGRETWASRSNWVLRFACDQECRQLLQEYVVDMDYDKSLLSWHIATELCWYADADADPDVKNYDREHAKLLSDYMMYLVTMQPAIMYGVTDIGQIRYRDTCADIKREWRSSESDDEREPSVCQVICYAFRQGIIFSLFTILSLFAVVIAPMSKSLHGKKEKEKEKVKKRTKAFCEKILQVNTDAVPADITGDRSKSVLFDGCRLAQEIRRLLGVQKWEIMSKVWVEMVSYAAVRSRPLTLAQPLSRGGELISFVWLLMAHFALVDQFDAARYSIAKLIVEK